PPSGEEIYQTSIHYSLIRLSC
ncbi:MAG: hypothetical protein QOH31_7008, partial [Verrucomicrobiota bacterium]